MKAYRFALVLALSVLGTSTAWADTSVHGNIYVDTTWGLAGSPYLVTGDLTVANQARLTIDPGVVVKVAATDDLGSNFDTARVEIIVDGELVANGTASQKVSFIPASGTAAGTWYGIRVKSDARDVSITNANLSGAVVGVTSESPYSVVLQNNAFLNMNTAASYVGVVKSPVFDSNTMTGSTGTAATVLMTATTTTSLSITNCNLGSGVTAVDVTNTGTNSLMVTIQDSTLTGNVNIASTASGTLTVALERTQVNVGGIRVTSTNGLATANIKTTTVDRAPREGILTGAKVTANIDRCTVRASQLQGVVVNWGGVVSNTAIYFCEKDGLLIAKDVTQPLTVTNDTILYNGTATPDSGIRVSAGSDAVGIPFVIQNTIVIKHPFFGISTCATCKPLLHNNDVWGNVTAYSGVAADASSVSVNPLFVGGLRDDATGGLVTTCIPEYMEQFPQVKTAQCSVVVSSCEAEPYCSTSCCGSSLSKKRKTSCSNSASISRNSTMNGSGKEWFYYVDYVRDWSCAGNSQTSTGWKSAGTGNTAAISVYSPAETGCTCAASSDCRIAVTMIADSLCRISRATSFDLDYNLALSSSSPLIDKGVNASAPTVDHDGAIRPFDGDFNGTKTVDIGAWEFGPTSIKVNPSTATLNQGDSKSFSVVGVDASGTEFPLSGATWSLADSNIGWMAQSGTFTAKDQLGTFTDAIKAQYGSLQAFASVTVNCRCTYNDACTPLPSCFLANTCTLNGFCSLDRLTVTPAAASVPVQKNQQFSVGGFDLFNNPVTLGTVTWAVVAGGGTIDGNGLFTAWFTPGTYANTIKVASGSKTAYASITVVPGQVETILVTPDPVQVTAGQTQQFHATAYDANANVVSGIVFEWAVERGGGTISTDGLFTAGCVTGTFSQTIAARFSAVSGHASVTVLSGSPTRMEVQPSSISLAGGKTTTFTAVGYDACGNQFSVSPTWAVTGGSGTINTATGEFTAGCLVGNYHGAITATFGSLTGQASVNVTAGQPITLVISPASATVGTQTTTAFSAKGYDACGTEVPVSATWSVEAGGGSIDASNGRFLAGCSLGVFTDTVRAAVGGVSAKATVTVGPGPAVTATVSPLLPNVPAGSSPTFTASAQDGCGHAVTASPTWSTTGGGSIDATGRYTAGCVLGPFPNSVVASFGAVQAKTGVTIQASTLAAIDVTPRTTTLDPLGSSSFSAAGRDSCGNPVTITPSWTVVAGGGSINAASGAFSAGTQAGMFTDTVRAQSGTVAGYGTVVVRGGAVIGLSIIPDAATVQPGAQAVFTALASDVYGNSWDVTPTWSVVNGGGSIDSSGRFTAGTTAGTYTDTVSASFAGRTARATVVVSPTTVSRIVVQPNATSAAVGVSVQFTASAFDAFDNPMTTTVVWSLAAGGGTIDATGRFTAGTLAGTYQNTLRATAGTVQGSATVTVLPGPLAALAIQPKPASVAAGQSLAFTASGQDAWGNAVVVSPAWSVVNGGGSINAQGIFTAGTSAGAFASTVRAQQGGVSAVVDVTVTAGPVAQVLVTPESASVQAGGRTTFSAACLDAYGNNTGSTATWSVEGSAGTVDAGGAFTAGTASGSYANAVRASCGTKTGYASATVLAGPLATLVVTPVSSEVVPSGLIQFQASGQDTYGNPVAAMPSWMVVLGGGSISSGGLFTAGNVAGTYPGTIRATQGAVTGSASVTVKPGPLASIVVSPANTAVAVGTEQTFTAAGRDAHGNDVALTGALTWSVVGGGGTIGSTTGTFKPTCTLGAFPNTVQVVSGAISGNASVTVVAGSVTDIEISPSAPTPAAAQTVSFTATPYDICGHVLDQPQFWSADPACGRITARGMFTVGTTAGTFIGCVTVGAGDEQAEQTVVVLPGPTASLTVLPREVALGKGGRQQFAASGADTWGNATAVSPSWSVVAGGGTITASGLFTAGNDIGLYADTVKALQGALSAFGSVRVLSEPVDSVSITPTTATTAVTRTVPFTAACLDRFGQATDAIPEWSVASGGGEISTGGIFSAGTKTGTSQVKASCGGVSSSVTVIITAGPLAILAVTPPMAVLTPGAATTFATSGEDIFGNAVVVVPVWSVIGNSGTIDTSTGLFTAGTKAGAWVGAVRASTSGQSATADVTVIPGPLAEIEVTPDSPVVTVKGQIQFQAAGTDAYGNAVSVPQDSYWSVTKGGGSFLASSGLFTAGCLPGTYEGTIQVATGSTKGLATVVVIAGTVTDLAVTPREAAVPVNEQITFQAAGADICGNAIEVAPTWTVVAGGGSVTSWGRFTAGRVAGRFQDTVQVALDGLQAYATVTVTAGPLSVISVKPASATLKPGNRRTFRAEGADAEGNAVEIVPVWSVAHGGGSIDGVGVFSAGDEEGVFAETVQATAAGTVVGTASVEVVMHAIPCGDDTDCPDDSSCDALKTCTDPVIEPGDQTPDSDDVGSIADSDGVGETTGADEGSVEPTADGVQGETASETGPSSETNGDLWDSGNRNDVVMEGGKSGGCNAHSANSGSDWMSFALSILAVGLLRKRRSKPVKTD